MIRRLNNLVSNAIKFSPEGGRIDVELGAAGADSVEICVRDEGAGIPEDELSSVFDKFVQSSRNSATAAGTGLGLAIARQIVQAHGGSIGATNNPRKGACFRFRFPRRQRAGG